MNIDWNATIAWIAFGVAVITPCVTTFLNNRFQLKLKNIEIHQKLQNEYLQKLSSVYTSYLEATSKILIDNNYLDELTNYSRAYHVIFLYLPTELHSSLEQLDVLISNKQYDKDSKDLLLHITKMLSDQLERAKQKPKR